MGRPIVIGIDPSGNWREGKGTTGFCVYNPNTKQVLEIMEMKAIRFITPEGYWHAHLQLLNELRRKHKDMVVSMESFLLYKNEAKSQVNSEFETPQLIGIIRLWCYNNDVTLYMRPAVRVKKRWTNKILEHKELIKPFKRGWQTMDNKPLVTHTLDSIRHAVHCASFELEEDDDI